MFKEKRPQIKKGRNKNYSKSSMNTVLNRKENTKQQKGYPPKKIYNKQG